MINLPANIRIYACVATCDMRKQMDGLAGLVRQGMARDPQSGDMYVFTNRRGDMVKILFYDLQGYCLLAKRLDRGTFKLTTDAGVETLELGGAELANFIRGLAIVKKAK